MKKIKFLTVTFSLLLICGLMITGATGTCTSCNPFAPKVDPTKSTGISDESKSASMASDAETAESIDDLDISTGMEGYSSGTSYSPSMMKYNAAMYAEIDTSAKADTTVVNEVEETNPDGKKIKVKIIIYTGGDTDPDNDTVVIKRELPLPGLYEIEWGKWKPKVKISAGEAFTHEFEIRKGWEGKLLEKGTKIITFSSSVKDSLTMYYRDWKTLVLSETTISVPVIEKFERNSTDQITEIATKFTIEITERKEKTLEANLLLRIKSGTIYLPKKEKHTITRTGKDGTDLGTRIVEIDIENKTMTVTRPDGTKVVWSKDGTTKVAQIYDANGNLIATQKITQNSDGSITIVKTGVDADGKSVQITIKIVTDQETKTRTVTKTYPDGTTETFTVKKINNGEIEITKSDGTVIVVKIDPKNGNMEIKDKAGKVKAKVEKQKDGTSKVKNEESGKEETITTEKT